MARYGRRYISYNSIMIPGAFLLLGGALLGVVNLIFGGLNLLLPAQIPTALTYFLSTLVMWRGWFPIDTLLECIVVLLLWSWRMYVIKIFFFLFSLLPWIGKRVHLPKMGSKK